MNYISLSKTYLLRKQRDGKFILYNKRRNAFYTITSKLFNFLYLYKGANYDLDAMFRYLVEHNIPTNDLIKVIGRKDFSDLFVSVESPLTINDNIYKNLSPISPFSEYTPERIDFLITRHCNLSCKHCFEEASPKIKTVEFPLKSLFSIFQQMEDLNVRTLKITGGEPFSHPHIKEILQEASRRRFECIVLTNGTLLNEEIIDIIVNGCIKLGISLDGDNSISHDFLRGNGNFHILMEKLSVLKKKNAIFCITMSVNRKNFVEIENVAKIVLDNLGAERFFVNQLKPLGRAKQNNSIFLSDKEYKEVIYRVSALVNKYGDKKISISDDALLVKTRVEQQAKMSLNSPLVCAGGNTSLSIDENLDVFPCIYGNGISKYKMGNLKTETLLNIWQSPKWSLFRGGTTLRDIDGCNACLNNSTCEMKNCRLKPVYNGQSFYSHVAYCNK